jgi:integrase
MARQATGQVIERKGKQGITYAARVRAYGQRHYISLGYSWEGATRGQAETELQNILADIRRGTWQPPQPDPAPAVPDDPTFHEFASQWFESRRGEVSPRTVDDYRWALSRHLLPFFKDHHLSQIRIPEVDRYRTRKVRERERAGVERPLSNRSINATLALLAQILEVAVEYGHMQFNPARGRRRRLKTSQPKRTWLEPEQIKPLLDGAVRGLRGGKTMPDPTARTLFATGICAGLRVGELLALRWGEVNLAQGRLTVLDAKTDAGIREVDIWPELCDELATYKTQTRHTKQDDYVFATRTGKADTRTNIAKRVKRAAERANKRLADEGGDIPPIPVELSPHSLRRTFASLLYLRGENPVYVMHQMGHTDPKLALRIYTKVIGDQRRRGSGARLVGVLDGAQWTGADSHDELAATDPAQVAVR